MAEKVSSVLHQDNNPTYQPPGTVRFAMNSVMETKEGTQGSRMNEEGNTLCIDFAANGLVGFKLIGAHRLSDGSEILFLTDNTYSIIGMKRNCTFTLYVKSTCLGFRTNKRISCFSRILNGCDRFIYFTDNYNPYYSMNLDNLNSYLLTGETVTTANADGEGWDCTIIKHFSDVLYPDIDLDRVKDTGGKLLMGMYSFTLRYVDYNNNVTNFMPLTQMIDVVDDIQDITSGSLAQHYLTVDGGINLVTIDGDTIGTDIITSKSIALELTNLDTRYRYYQLAVVEYVENLKTPTNYYILERVAIPTTGNSNYVYPGFNAALHELTSQAEITISKTSINTVQAHAQHDDKLFLANVTEYTKDWSKFQREVNKITTGWESRAYENYRADMGFGGDQLPSTKKPGNYYYYKSYMRDEIYAFGVVFMFKDGSYSPVFHIPGTAADTTERLGLIATGNANTSNRAHGITLWDREPLTVVTTPSSLTAGEVAFADVEHLGLSNGDVVERWKVYNTAIVTARTVLDDTASLAEGLMSFWECETAVYPLDVDCDGNYVYDLDAYGNVLAGSPIRHHKFPDNMLDEHFDSDISYIGLNTLDRFNGMYHRPLAIVFSNVNYPAEFASEVAGYYIVRCQRDDFNKTVITKGLYNRTYLFGIPPAYHFPPQLAFGSGGFVQGYGAAADDGKQGSLISQYSTFGKYGSNVNQLERQAPVGDYLKFEGRLRAPYNSDNWRETYFLKRDTGVVNVTNRKLILSLLVASLTETATTPPGFLYPLYNNNWMNDVNFISTSSAIPNTDNTGFLEVRRAWYVAVKSNRPDAYGSLADLSYIKTHSNLHTETSQFLFATVFGGDVYTNSTAFLDWFTTPGLAGMPGFIPGQVTTASIPLDDTSTAAVSFIPLEEEVNMALQHDGVDIETEAYAHYLYAANGFRLDGSNGKGFNIEPTTQVAPDFGTLVRQWYALNPDFHAEADILKFFPIESNYKWCDSCRDKKPNHIFYSDKGEATDSFDAYKNIRAGNVTRVYPEDGPITNLILNKDRLFAHLVDSIVLLQTRPQQLVADGTTVYTGTAEVFAASPKRLQSSDLGYAGSQDKFGTVSNEFGNFFVDTIRGKVFLFQDSLKEISNEGLRNWFREELPFNLLKYIIYSPEDLYTSDINGAGIMSCYDAKFRRFILHKKDYKPLDTITFGGILPELEEEWEVDTLYYYLDANDVIHWQYNEVEVFDNDENLFENKSWTISYSLANGGWVCWHSYMPNFSFGTNDTFYSFIVNHPDTEGIWMHNSFNYQTYYGTKFPYILEIIADGNLSTGVYPNLEFISKTEEYNVAGYFTPAKNPTFDAIWTYDDIHSSDIMTMTPMLNDGNTMGASVYNNKLSDATILYRNTEYNFRLNKLRDIVDNTYALPVFDASWGATNSQRNLVNNYQGYIDKVPRTAAHNSTKSNYNNERYRYKYLAIRLFFNPEENLRIITDVFESFKHISIR